MPCYEVETDIKLNLFIQWVRNSLFLLAMSSVAAPKVYRQYFTQKFFLNFGPREWILFKFAIFHNFGKNCIFLIFRK